MFVVATLLLSACTSSEPLPGGELTSAAQSNESAVVSPTASGPPQPQSPGPQPEGASLLPPHARGEGELVLLCDEGVEVQVDGLDAGICDKKSGGLLLLVKPGQREITAERADDNNPWRRRLDIAVGANPEVRIEFEVGSIEAGSLAEGTESSVEETTATPELRAVFTQIVSSSATPSVLELSADGSFQLVVNLCEAMGRVEGSWERPDSSQLELKVARRDFSGFRGDKISEARFRIHGDELKYESESFGCGPSNGAEYKRTSGRAL